jgi:aquaporin Z
MRLNALSAEALILLAGTCLCTLGQVYDEFDDEVSILQTELRVRKGHHGSTRVVETLAGNSELKKHMSSQSLGQVPMTTPKPVETESIESSIPWVLVAAMFFGLAYMASRWSDDSKAWSKYIAEFIGTFMFVFSIGCNEIGSSTVSATWAVTSVAFTRMVMMYALAPISGAHFNPAVSLAMAASNRVPWVEALVYVPVQMAAGICGGVACGTFIGAATSVGPATGHSGWQAGLVEMLYTFLVTFVFLNTDPSQKNKGPNEFFGLAVSFTIIAAGYGAGNISGGCFNPAVALGAHSSGLSLAYGWCFAYWVFEGIGCVLAVVLFRLCRPEDFEDSASESDKGKEEDSQSDTNASSAGGSDEPVPLHHLLSEFLGTYFLVLTVGLNVLTFSKATYFSVAACSVCTIFALHSVSGAHFNPAVTLAIACSARNLIKPMHALYYVLAQICAGVCGAFTYTVLMNGQTVALAPAAGASTQALLGELIFTCLLCFVFLSVATGKNRLVEYFGLAIGATIVAGGFAMGKVSGGSLNPAVSAGLSITDCVNGGTLEHFISYSAVQLLGGALAALIHRKTHASEYPKRAD